MKVTLMCYELLGVAVGSAMLAGALLGGMPIAAADPPEGSDGGYTCDAKDLEELFTCQNDYIANECGGYGSGSHDGETWCLPKPSASTHRPVADVPFKTGPPRKQSGGEHRDHSDGQPSNPTRQADAEPGR